MKSPLLLGIATLTLSGLSSAQGADDCANAQAISGLGPHAFDNTAATLDGTADCNGKNTFRDVWFRWVAPQSGGYKFETCGQSNIPVRAVVYDGASCPAGSPIACGDSGCVFDTRFSFPTTAGQTYLVRVGAKNQTTSGTGSFTFIFDPCVTTPDDGFEENDDCASAVPVGDGAYPGNVVKKTDTDWFRMDVADGATITVDALFLHSNGNIETWLFDACGGTLLDNGGSITDNETVTWSNATGSCRTVLFQVEMLYSDPNNECNTYDLVVAGSSAPGTCGGCFPTVYCDPASGSTNNLAGISIDACSLQNTTSNLVHLVSAPPNQFAYLLIGDGSSKVTDPPGALGDLCIVGGSCVGRYSKDAFAADGSGNGEVNIAQSLSGGPGYGIPTCGGNIGPGETWNFQFWHRQPMGQPSAFSQALSVTFQ